MGACLCLSAALYLACANITVHCGAQFLQPSVSITSGAICREEIDEIASTGSPFGGLSPHCYTGVENAVISMLAMASISYIKMPQLLSMLSRGVDGLPTWPWSGWRATMEWFSLVFILSYHQQMEHDLVMYWEQLALLLHCTIALFHLAVQEQIMDDEMSTFGGMSCLGCGCWLLFAMDLHGDAVWVLPLLSAVFQLLRDGYMIRYGDIEENPEVGKRPRVRYDGDYASHTMYFFVGAVRCYGLLPHRMGLHYDVNDKWAALRYGTVSICAMLMAVEAWLASALRKKQEAASAARNTTQRTEQSELKKGPAKVEKQQ